MFSVCYVLPEYPVLSQTFVHAELVALAAAGVKVGVVCQKAGDPGIRFGEGPDGLPFPVLHTNLSAPDLDAVLGQFDHLHGHFADFGVRTLGPIAERVGKPFSMMCHAYDLFRQDAAVRPGEWQRLSKNCSKVITISRFHRDFIAERGVAKERIAVVPNAARLAHLIASAPPAPTSLKKVLAVGRPTPKKGFQVLINAWQAARGHLPELELEIIGAPVPSGPLPPGLTLSPMRPYAEVLQAMAQADLIVAPCVKAPNGDMDGIPTVLAEAGALNRPVISSELSGIGDLVVNGVNGLLLPPGDVHALKMALIRLGQRPLELRRMGLSAQRLAACHDASVCAQRLIEAFQPPTAALPTRVLIADSFCSANRGDAAIVQGIVSGLQERLPDAQIRVVSHYPKVAAHFHPDLDCMGDADPVALAQALVETDLVVSCGGSFLNDLYALNLGPRLALYHAAHRAEIPVIFFAQSIGPLESPLSRQAARQVLDPAAWVLARDPASAQIVRRLGVQCPVSVGVDAAVSDVPEFQEKQSVPVLGVTARAWHFPGHDNPQELQSAYEANVAAACHAWMTESGGQVRLLSNCTDFGGYHQDDRLAARRIARAIDNAGPIGNADAGQVSVEERADLDHRHVRRQAAACDFFLGTRMHSLIFATTAGVPAVGVAYEFKTPEWLAMCGLEGLSVDISDTQGLTQLLLEAWRDRQTHRAKLAAALPGILSQAETQLDQLARIAQGAHLPRATSGCGTEVGWQGETLKYDIAHRRLCKVADIVLAESGRRVLDVGCSTGILGRMLGPRFSYHGLDVSHEVVVQEPGFSVQQRDLNTQGFPKMDPVDTVICSGSLEYIEDLQGTLRALRERIVSGGLGVFTLYNLSHFARAVGRSSRHPTWTFQARPDELVMALREAGFTPQRITYSAAGYTPSQAVNAELPTDWDRQGGGQLSPKRLQRLAHQVIVVCRATPPQAGPQRVEDLATAGDLLGATRIAAHLVKRFPWSARAWSDLGVLFQLAGDVQTGTKHLLKAVECDPCNPVVLENLAGLGVDPVQAFAEHPDPELRVLLNPKDAQAWQTLIQNALDRGLLSSAKVLKRLSLRSLSASPPASQARATEHRISSPRPG
jgi:colanic acid/amylovoran biosynthesis protein